MPNLDGTGPRGEGPKTGLGKGNCSPEQDNNTPTGNFVTRLFRNRRNNGGRGLGRGNGRMGFWKRW